jgi:hypothetical protein
MATIPRTPMDVWCCYDNTRGSEVWTYCLVADLTLAWTLAGIGYFRYLRANRPAMLDAIGRVWEPDLGAGDRGRPNPAA